MAMTDTLLPDDPQTVERLSSLNCLLEWVSSMPMHERKRFFGALAECNAAVQQVVVRILEVVKNPSTLPTERHRALMTIADALFPHSDDNGDYGLDLPTSEAAAAAEHPSLAREVMTMDAQEATFAQRLRGLMDSRRVSQLELADRVGCSQPAISQMLNRNCRPQKKTILKLAEALNVHASELWPDIEVAEMLDAVASFQQPNYEMSNEEAIALSDTSRPNRPTIRVKPLPSRR